MKRFPSELPERAYQDVLDIYNTEAMKEKYIKFYNSIAPQNGGGYCYELVFVLIPCTRTVKSEFYTVAEKAVA